jgi:hypothetical protein
MVEKQREVNIILKEVGLGVTKEVIDIYEYAKEEFSSLLIERGSKIHPINDFVVVF